MLKEKEEFDNDILLRDLCFIYMSSIMWKIQIFFACNLIISQGVTHMNTKGGTSM
jgi:hypothetical protein